MKQGVERQGVAGPVAQRSRWTILTVATLVQAASGFVVLGVASLAAFVRDDFALSGAQTGLLVTAVGLAPLFGLMPAGRLLDRHGERRIVALGGVWLAAGALLASLSPGYLSLLVALAIGGAGYATSQPGGSKAVATWFDAGRRGFAMGVRQTGLPLGGALAAFALPRVAEAAGWRAALWVAAGVGLLGAALFAAVYQEPSTGESSGSYSTRAHLQAMLRSRSMRTSLWAGFVMVSAQFCLVSYLMLFLHDDGGVPLTQGALLVAAAQVGGMGGRVVLASWSDRLGRGRRMVPVLTSACAASILVALLPVLPATTVGPLSGVAVVLGFFVFGWYGPWVAHVAELGPLGSAGFTLSFAMTANQLGIVAAPPLFGLVLDLSGSYATAWWGLSAALAAVSVVILRSLRRTSVSP